MIDYMYVIFETFSFPLSSRMTFLTTNFCTIRYVLDPKLLATHARKAGAIAFMGMAVPFALGIAISQTMFDTLQV